MERIQAQRTTSNVYHLLTGKRSIQTIQDAHVYQLKNFYGVHKRLSKQYFDNKINDLIEKNLLDYSAESKSVCKLTQQGGKWLEIYKDDFPLHHFKGLKYLEMTDIFYYRLVLLIQTLTNSKMNYFSFIPVIDKTEIGNWVKQLYKKVKGKERDVLAAVYEELFTLLTKVSELEANIFVDRLTGFKHYGLSTDQLATAYRISVADVHLLLTGVVHKLLDEIMNNHTKFESLTYIISDLNHYTPLTNSARQTYQLWKKGLSTSEIVAIRQLKISTIYDHIVEIAIYELDFPLENYVSQETLGEITNAISKVKTNRLKDIKELVDDQVNYFQIRLVLAVKNKFTN